jgi:hypothetical protein
MVEVTDLVIPLNSLFTGNPEVGQLAITKANEAGRLQDSHRLCCRSM